MISYANKSSSGKHLVCDFKDITNKDLLNDIDGIMREMDIICNKFKYTVLEKVSHAFLPQGITVLYLLSESHLSIHTFPEKNYMAFDIYTCRPSDDNSASEWIYHHLVDILGARREENLMIIDRSFH